MAVQSFVQIDFTCYQIKFTSLTNAHVKSRMHITFSSEIHCSVYTERIQYHSRRRLQFINI